jgi:predicted amidophosphoribosyltransferase
MVARCSRRIARLAGGAVTALGDLIFLPGCLRCSGSSLRRRAGVCLSCWAAARPARRPSGRCLDCGDPGGACSHPLPPWSWATAALTYEGAGRDLIRLYKFGPEGGRLPLARPLAGLLAAALRADGAALDVDLVVPVPSHRLRRRQRGFDAAATLARHAAAGAGLGAPCRLLWRRGSRGPRAIQAPGTGSQSDYLLRRGARRRLVGRTVLVLDDVCTTGATLRRCAGLLLDGGAAEVRAAVLAFTPRRFFAGARAID